ncbi:hypothetical protein HDV02_005876, partial [Globomyces sp. JEL0801]
ECNTNDDCENICIVGPNQTECGVIRTGLRLDLTKNVYYTWGSEKQNQNVVCSSAGDCQYPSVCVMSGYDSSNGYCREYISSFIYHKDSDLYYQSKSVVDQTKVPCTTKIKPIATTTHLGPTPTATQISQGTSIDNSPPIPQEDINAQSNNDNASGITYIVVLTEDSETAVVEELIGNMTSTEPDSEPTVEETSTEGNLAAGEEVHIHQGVTQNGELSLEQPIIVTLEDNPVVNSELTAEEAVVEDIQDEDFDDHITASDEETIFIDDGMQGESGSEADVSVENTTDVDPTASNIEEEVPIDELPAEDATNEEQEESDNQVIVADVSVENTTDVDPTASNIEEEVPIDELPAEDATNEEQEESDNQVIVADVSVENTTDVDPTASNIEEEVPIDELPAEDATNEEQEESDNQVIVADVSVENTTDVDPTASNIEEEV